MPDAQTMQSTRRRIWAISDGRASNEAQALGLAEAVARLLPADIEVKRTMLLPGLRVAPARVWAAIPPRRGGWPFSGLADRGAALAGPWPDLAIGAGRRSAPLVAAMRAIDRREGGRLGAVQLMDPRMAARAFDLVIVPEHAGARGPNLIRTCGALNRVLPDRLAEAAARWAPRLGALPRPRVAVLVGGPSGAARIDRAAAGRLIGQLARLAAGGAGLMVTPSARTPPELGRRLAEALGGFESFVWDCAGDNPYLAMLALADAIVVTGDSVSMTSEAASTGRPVLVAALGPLRARIGRFQERMRAAGYTRPFTGALESWAYEPLREADRVAPRVAALLAPAPEPLPESGGESRP
ncbi:MAG TPA: mitochondrial fission ELM1 family protein [Thermohalobaculum sp.]|nr:mitochondrial fission ELM1 family protein [Thermohalobaculum sp.]